MKRAQLQHPMNWILVLFGGAFFLILFVIIARSVMDTGQGTSEAAAINSLTNMIDRTKANPDTTFDTTIPQVETSCDDKVFSLRSGRQERSFATHAIFGPSVLEEKVTVRSEEFSIVNPVTTFTYLFPHDTMYVFTQDVSREFYDSFEGLPRMWPEVGDLSNLDFTHPHVVIVDAGSVDNLESTTLNFGRANTIRGVYYYKNSGVLKMYHYDRAANDFIEETLDSRDRSGREEFVLAAIASASNDTYTCGLFSAKEQSNFLAKINDKRTEKLLTYSPSPVCIDAYEYRAKPAFRDLILNGFQNLVTAENDLLRATKTLGDNGCPNI